MKLRCSTCGLAYPENWSSFVCGYCGGLIESARLTSGSNIKNVDLDNLWKDWQEKMNSAPPRPLKEEDWLNACSVFNGCAVCGSESIDEKLLLVPPFLGGKLYTYNVIPSCSFCADRIRQSQNYNPIKPFYTLRNMNKDRTDKILRYLESIMLCSVFEEFNWDEDSIEIVVVVAEDTSTLPFNGIWARRLFDEPRIKVEFQKESAEFSHDQEVHGVTWRLL